MCLSDPQTENKPSAKVNILNVRGMRKRFKSEIENWSDGTIFLGNKGVAAEETWLVFAKGTISTACSASNVDFSLKNVSWSLKNSSEVDCKQSGASNLGDIGDST